MTSSKTLAEWPPISAEMKPWTRWWWLGSAVSRSDISDLLSKYSASNIGGVEITPIYGMVGNEPNEISYLSLEWVDMLQFTIAEAAANNMLVDMSTGTGWPFGGPNVSSFDSLDHLVVQTNYARGSHTEPISSDQSLLLCAYGRNASGRRIAFSLDNAYDGEYRFRLPDNELWSVYTARLECAGRSVKRAALGGEGRCINPFSKKSVRSYLTRFDTSLKDLDHGALRCHFHDSFEYLADCCPDFMTEFNLRRGYDLERHLDMLTFDTDSGDHRTRIKTDYRQTIAELLLERFTLTWSRWAHSKGSLSRNQAHGSPGNLLDLYAAVDIPETEIFGDFGNPLITKFASSAAHVGGHRLCSSESCTWLDEHFNVTLAQAKSAIDRLFVSGVNHVFYHGTAYSPLTDPWPGRLFYASTTFAPQDPTWHDLPTLNSYVARSQSILQSGRHDNDLLIYWPLSDLWMRKPDVFMLEIGGKWNVGEPFEAIGQHLWDNGWQFDYVSDAQLTRLNEADSFRRYKAIVVPKSKYMPVDTISALLSLANEGRHILFVDSFPKDVPGLGDLDKNRERFKSIVGELTACSVAATQTDIQDLLVNAGVRCETSRKSMGIDVIRRKTETGFDYFIVNNTRSPIYDYVALSSLSGDAILMDPMTGGIGRARCKIELGLLNVLVHLAIGQSIIIRVIEQENLSELANWPYTTPSGPPIELVGPWSVEFLNGGPSLPSATSACSASYWTDLNIQGADEFSGTAAYSNTFDSPDQSTLEWRLDLGNVCESAEIWLNDNLIGTTITAPHYVNIPFLLPSDNRLTIKITNLSANRIRYMDINKIEWRRFRDINFVNKQYQPFDASNWPVRASGLQGPVTLTPMQHIGTLC